MSYITAKRATGYVTVKIPRELASEIDQFLKQPKNRGYTSWPDIVKAAVRRLLDQELKWSVTDQRDNTT